MQVITKARRACSNAGAAVHRVIVENDAKLNPVRRWVLGTYAARPSVLLALLTICNLLNYADRGLTAGLLDRLTDRFDLNEVQGGSLSSLFMVGFMIMSPLFGHYVRHIRPTLLMSFGLSVWVFSAVFSGSSWSYVPLLIARMCSGVGEASFAGISPAYVEDVSDKRYRVMWLGIFFSAIPLGYALGYVTAGVFYDSWRVPYFIEAALMSPFVFGCLLLPDAADVVRRYRGEKEENDVHDDLDVGTVEVIEEGLEMDDVVTVSAQLKLHGAGDEEERQQEQSRAGVEEVQQYTGQERMSESEREVTFFEDVLAMGKNGRFLCTMMCYSAITFVMGALSFWTPKYLTDELLMDGSIADYGIGAVTVAAGIIGGVGGGFVADFVSRTPDRNKNNLRTSLFVFSLVSCSLPLSLFAFSLNEPWQFFIVVFVAELLFFSATTPINGLTLSVVDHSRRSFAMTSQIFLIHLFGDFPSPILVGAIAKKYGIRAGMYFASSWVTIAVLFAGAGSAVMYMYQRRHARDMPQHTGEVVEASSFKATKEDLDAFAEDDAAELPAMHAELPAMHAEREVVDTHHMEGLKGSVVDDLFD